MANHKPKPLKRHSFVVVLIGVGLALLASLPFIPFVTDGTWRYSGVKRDVARWAVDWANTKYPTERPLVYIRDVRPLRHDEAESYCRYNDTEPADSPNDPRYYAVSFTVMLSDHSQTYHLGCESLAPPSF